MNNLRTPGPCVNKDFFHDDVFSCVFRLFSLVPKIDGNDEKRTRLLMALAVCLSSYGCKSCSRVPRGAYASYVPSKLPACIYNSMNEQILKFTLRTLSLRPSDFIYIMKGIFIYFSVSLFTL